MPENTNSLHAGMSIPVYIGIFEPILFEVSKSRPGCDLSSRNHEDDGDHPTKSKRGSQILNRKPFLRFGTHECWNFPGHVTIEIMSIDTGLNHVAILVRSVSKAAEYLRKFEFQIGEEEDFDGEGTREIYV